MRTMGTGRFDLQSMKLFAFIKNWTLPLSMLSGSVLYLLFAFIPAFDGVSPALGVFFDAILPLFMFLVLFVTFCKVDFRKLVPVKWNYCVSLFQVAFVWILVGAILFFRLKGQRTDVCRVGPDLHYRALCRGSTRSDRQTRRTTGGNHHLWLSLQFPLCDPHSSLLPAHRAVVGPRLLSCRRFLRILYQVCIVLVLPMGLAFFVKHFKPLQGFHQWVINVKDLSFYLWAVQLMIVSGATVKNIVHAHTTLPFLLAIAFSGLLVCVVQFAVGRSVGRLF